MGVQEHLGLSQEALLEEHEATVQLQLQARLPSQAVKQLLMLHGCTHSGLPHKSSACCLSSSDSFLSYGACLMPSDA